MTQDAAIEQQLSARMPDPGFAVADPVLRPITNVAGVDWTAIIGLVGAHALVLVALLLTGDGAGFVDIPAIMIVIGGTVLVTVASFRWIDITSSWPIITGTFRNTGADARSLARLLVDMSIIVRKYGILGLAGKERFWRGQTTLYPYVLMIVDGYAPEDIERLAAQDLDTALDGYRKAASILRRAAETAPAMGLIGTLVGLVQMLGDLQNPEALGPSMALALLTTFYGAMLGTVFLAPLVQKVERNANREATERQMILTAACAISTIENPRRVEMTLNGFLPADQRLSYMTKDMG